MKVSLSISDTHITHISQGKHCCGIQNVGWLVDLPPSNMLVCLREGSTQTSVPAATMRLKLQIKLCPVADQTLLCGLGIEQTHCPAMHVVRGD